MKHKTIQALILTAALALSSLTPVSAAEMDTGDQTGAAAQGEETLTTEESQELAEEKILNEDQETIPGETEDNTDSSSDVVMPGNDGENPQAENPQVENLLSGSWILNATGWWYAYDDGSWPSNGIYDIDGTKYAFDASGYMVTGWYLNQDGWYYFNGSGAMVTGWQLVGGTWYYLDGANAEHPGLMVSGGWNLINNAWYYMNGSGGMMSEWLLLGNTWYYLGGDGAMKTGWQQIGASWYYFYTENDPNGGAYGAMAVSTTIDGWEILESGIAVQDLAAKINEIKKYIYVPYRYGGTTPGGWDCSGFTQWALHYLGGITIPRTTTLQAAGGTNINKNHMELWKSGDVLVYQSGSSFTHVALYLGDGMLMHAINSKYGTMIQGVEYYEQWDSGNHLALVRRYL